MSRADDILRAINQLYAAAAQPDAWTPALEFVTDLLRGDHAVVHADASTIAPGAVCITARIDERDLARSAAASAGCDLGRLSPGLFPVGRVWTRAEIMPDREFARTAYYNDCVRPLNGFHAISFRQIDLPAPFLLAVCRPERTGNFGAEEAAILQRLAPHVATVLELHGRLQAANHQRVALAQVFDQLDSGVIVTDASAHPVFVNHRALDITAQSDGLLLGPTGLSGPTPRLTQRLRAAIAGVGADGGSHRRQLRLERPSRRPPLLLTLLPVWRLGIALPGVATPRVAIFIKEPDIPVTMDHAALVEAFRLTPRESEIAALMAGGLDLSEIAATLAISRGTAAFHLNRIFDKTGVRSQAKLVSLLRGFNRSLS
jgi:DNA-binding CsgD family transcriptional regulator/PAS domain-containing protein